MAKTYNSKSLLATYQSPILPPGSHARETDSQPAIVIQLFLGVLMIEVIDRRAKRVHCDIISRVYVCTGISIVYGETTQHHYINGVQEGLRGHDEIVCTFYKL
jgi:hypothetical protein